MLHDSPRARHIVLVLEDELIVRMAVCAALMEAGFGVVDSDHADWALAYLRNSAQQIQALFTDIHLPGSMDGLKLAHLSRRTWPWISLLIASARAQPTTDELPQGARFIPKPYEHEEVIHHLRELVSA